MSIESSNPEHGFQFPGVFELTAMGPAGAALEREIPELLQKAGIRVLQESVTRRDSSGGKFVSVRLSVEADSREEYERAHQALRSHPEVKWTI